MAALFEILEGVGMLQVEGEPSGAIVSYYVQLRAVSPRHSEAFGWIVRPTEKVAQLVANRPKATLTLADGRRIDVRFSETTGVFSSAD